MKFGDDCFELSHQIHTTLISFPSFKVKPNDSPISSTARHFLSVDPSFILDGWRECDSSLPYFNSLVSHVRHIPSLVIFPLSHSLSPPQSLPSWGREKDILFLSSIWRPTSVLSNADIRQQCSTVHYLLQRLAHYSEFLVFKVHF